MIEVWMDSILQINLSSTRTSKMNLKKITIKCQVIFINNLRLSRGKLLFN